MERGRVGATGIGSWVLEVTRGFVGRADRGATCRDVNGEDRLMGEEQVFSWFLCLRKFLVRDFFQCLAGFVSGLFMSRTTRDIGLIWSRPRGELSEATLPGDMVEDTSESIPLSSSSSNSSAIFWKLKLGLRSPNSRSSIAELRSQNGNGALPNSFSLLIRRNGVSMLRLCE